MTLHSTFKSFLVLGLIAFVTACSSKKLEGVYEADFSSSDDPMMQFVGALAKISLVFDGDKVLMRVEGMGEKEEQEIQAEYKGDTVILSKEGEEEKLVMLIKDKDTLQCQECPQGMPPLWKKKTE